MSGSVSILDVARRARVSPATVSRVLNGFSRVSPDTRERVLKAAAALDYHPNANARALSHHANRTLGVIVSNLDNPYFLDVYRAIEEEASRDQYELLVANTSYSPERLVRAVDMMLSRRVAALAAIVSEMDAAVLDQLGRAGIPVVVSGVETRHSQITNIAVDCRAAMAAIVEYLRALGHSRMAFIDHHSALETIGDRRRTFLDALGADAEIVSTSDSFEGGREAVRKLQGNPTAIVCVNDRIAIGALKELEAAGRRVPDDVSVTGFDNIDYAAYANPPLTTVDIPRAVIGSLVFARLTGGAPDTVVTPQLVIRSSTATATR
jgi:LacI family transcriptional regulator